MRPARVTQGSGHQPDLQAPGPRLQAGAGEGGEVRGWGRRAGLGSRAHSDPSAAWACRTGPGPGQVVAPGSGVGGACTLGKGDAGRFS